MLASLPCLLYRRPPRAAEPPARRLPGPDRQRERDGRPHRRERAADAHVLQLRGQALILWLHGHGRVVLLDVESIMTTCGFAMPLFDKGDALSREAATPWSVVHHRKRG